MHLRKKTEVITMIEEQQPIWHSTICIEYCVFAEICTYLERYTGNWQHWLPLGQNGRPGASVGKTFSKCLHFCTCRTVLVTFFNK